MDPVIVFVNGLSGTGKSSLVQYFKKHPLRGWIVYDFDFGKYKIPKETVKHHAWRVKQQKHWLQTGLDNAKRDLRTTVFGFSLWPETALTLSTAKKFKKKNIHFALLHTNAVVRKKRLYSVGRKHLWRGHQNWYDEFYDKVRKYSEIEIDSSDLTIVDVAKKMKRWLNNVN